jgi:hypothetical protein
MKIFGLIGTTLLLLLLGTGVSVYAQDQRDDAKPQAQEEEKPKQDEAKPAKPAEDKSMKQEEEKKDETGRKQDEKNESGKAEHTQAAETRGGQASRIPDEKFRANFGREHTFHIGHPTIVEGRPRFQYGGYSFVMVEPWPVGWAYTDAVYIDFIDGAYYLIDPVHPGVQIVVNVVM